MDKLSKVAGDELRKFWWTLKARGRKLQFQV